MSSIKRRALESSTVIVLLRHRVLIVCMCVCVLSSLQLDAMSGKRIENKRKDKIDRRREEKAAKAVARIFIF